MKPLEFPLKKWQSLERKQKFLFLIQSVQTLIHVWHFATPWIAACPGFPVQLLEPAQLMPFASVQHLNIWSSVVPFSSCLQPFSASGSFPMSQFFASGGHSTRPSTSASVLPIQDWFLLGWTGWIFLQSKGFSRVISNTTVQKHLFLGTQLSLWPNSHICTWLLEKP